MFSVAAQYFERTLELDPTDADVRTGLAVCYRSMGEINRAVDELEEGLRLWGERYEILLLLANILLEEGFLDRAIEYAERAVEAAPERADPHYILGMAYKKKGMVEVSKSEFELLEELRNASPQDQ